MEGSSETSLLLPSSPNGPKPGPDTVSNTASANSESEGETELRRTLAKSIRRKVDLRLCTIAGILCSLNLLDSGIISSASVTSIFQDLDLGQGNRYSVAILIYTVANVLFQLPATVAVRTFGPRAWFASITFAFGLITLVSSSDATQGAVKSNSEARVVYCIRHVMEAYDSITSSVGNGSSGYLPGTNILNQHLVHEK
ncbi:MAG: hypothetical protein M1837_002710 [Sclerophora amabilis]|nr:MAG: hypothetical protein M1837_002710 [Sclerophora amabilis]